MMHDQCENMFTATCWLDDMASQPSFTSTEQIRSNTALKF